MRLSVNTMKQIDDLVLDFKSKLIFSIGWLEENYAGTVSGFVIDLSCFDKDDLPCWNREYIKEG